MWDNRGRRWRQDKYQGYGVFGGKDYFVLLAEMNREYAEDICDERKREDGLEMLDRDDVLYPNLTMCPDWEWQNSRPKLCPHQGFGDYMNFEEGGEDWDYNASVRNYHLEDEMDEWPNGSAKRQVAEHPHNLLEVNPPTDTAVPNQTSRISEEDTFRNTAEECRYKATCDKINYTYHVVGFYEGVITDGHVYKNPHWIVMEKNHMFVVYDTTFVITYCEGGEYVKMSVDNYKKIQDFCSENNESLLLYIEGRKLKGHCKHPSNLEKANETLEPIYNSPEKDKMMWYQSFCF
jgi:hypothetical protein